jgi:hypothetical protein
MLQCSYRVRAALRRALVWEPVARFGNMRELTVELQRAIGQHPTEDVRGSVQGRMDRERGAHFTPIARTSEQQDQLPSRGSGYSTQWNSGNDSLDLLLSSLPVYGSIVSVFGGLGVTLAISGLFLIVQGIHAGLVVELAVAVGMVCVGFGLSIAYVAAQSVYERARALAAASHSGSRYRSRATVMAIVAGVGLIAAVLIAA